MNADERAAESEVVDTSRSPYSWLRPVPMAGVRIEGGFWGPRLRTVRQVTLRQQYEQCEQTGRIDHFRRAAGKKAIEFVGRYYDDSDVYKWLEAASYALAAERDPALERTVDELIGEIAAAQSPDGYLNTYFTFERERERWTNLTQMHEMYCAGHFIQAAVAHHRATGKRTALDVATSLADHISATFNPAARLGTDGHEEIELALVELYRATGDRTYLDEAGYLLDARGRRPPVLSGTPYHQDHLPVREQREIVGHAVRATYLAIGMADVYAETGDAGLRDAVGDLWRSAFERKAYITGGLGAHWAGEAFGADYELPNARAYAETCAAIGGFLWNWRMLANSGAPSEMGRFADWMETALYNGILSGLSLDGLTYFYQNPLADQGTHRRQPWFGTACCPPNIARLLLGLPGYLYSATEAGLWIHHYVAGSVQTALPGGGTASLRVATEYPWDGAVRLTLTELGPGERSLYVRLPSWTERASVRVNGATVDAESDPGQYAELRRVWQRGDVVELNLPMSVRRQVSHPRVASNAGRVALSRGPIVYCVEGVDHPGTEVWDLAVPYASQLTAERAPDLLDGVTLVCGDAVEAPAIGWNNRLYGPAAAGERGKVGQHDTERRPARLTAVPYYAWANRAPGAMQVWIRSE